MKTWDISESLKLYHIQNWGDGYFNVNDAGNLVVYPERSSGPGIDLTQVLDEVKNRKLKFPVLIRFQDIIRDRVIRLNETFRKSIEEAEYQGQYRGVYPIKVNQMREVVEEIVDAGKPYDYGLEAGSKTELAAVVAMDLSPEALVICNGYKDSDIIKTALLGKKLGKKVFVVVEKLSELDHVIRLSKELNIRPLIGVRSKLSTRGSGKWESSGGDFAKFGLSTPEILKVVYRLKEEKMEDCFKLLHFHVGSQITNIRTISNATKEAARIYSKLQKMGLDLDYLDVGGGLGVDYDGSSTDYDSSMNYSLEEYVADVVYSIKEVCDAEEVKHPHIVSESGRAIVAHHSVLVVDVFGKIQMTEPDFKEDFLFKESDDEHEQVKKMREVLESLTTKKLLENYHDALHLKEDGLNLFKVGLLSLEDRAKIEQLFWTICKEVSKKAKSLRYIPDELNDLKKDLAHQYLCNFSLFQSMPDHWAIQHLFPVIPIHRLNEEPTVDSILVDITCDSDGKINKFIDLREVNETLKVHPLESGKPYYLGFFLMGAYQDIMGDLHNLFGRVNEVHVFLDENENDGYYIEEAIRGNSLSEVLEWIQYSSPWLKKEFKKVVDEKVRDKVIHRKQGYEYLDFYQNLLSDYTYVNYVDERQNVDGMLPGLTHSDLDSNPGSTQEK
ncbi:MAG: arginine decarboxylase [Bdellovibrionaceae bacterium]|nr:arginine decarboxylase [Pseudobdellovibrionaceae bacterium]